MELKDDRRFHNLTREQVETLDQVLTEVIPIHGRGNFPTLEIKPKDIIHVVRDRLVSKHIKVRDVRLNGSTASHVLVKENGTSYKDLDIIFGVELPKAEDFQIIKEVVLSCLLDFLPPGVNKNKITVLTMKEAYVQKMVKVFTEHDRWSLISLCNNSGKNVELKFVSSLRRQFEFSVDSFQIILDTMLESYLEAERQEAAKLKEKQHSENPSDVLSEQMTSTSTQSFEETDISMSDETKDILNECHSDSEIIEGSKPSTEEIPIDLTHKDISEELTSSVALAAESRAELLDTKINKNNEALFTQKDVMLEVNLNSVMMCERNNQSQVQPTDSETHSHIKEPDHENKTASQLVESAPLMEQTSATHEPMRNPETDTEPMILTDQFTFHHSHGATFLPQTTQDSSNEYSAPPPAKKTSWTSQMVVLKHSSPKPPRKMSRKVICSSKSLKGKPSQPHSLSVSDQKESMSMQIESPGLTTNCLSSASHDQESMLREVDLSTTILKDQDKTVPSEEVFSVDCSLEKTHKQKPEPETGETTNHSVPSPVSESFAVQTEMEIQSCSEIKTCPDPVTPIIQVNSLPVVELEDGPALLPNTGGKEKTETTSRTSECPKECSKLPENDTHTLDSSTDSKRTDQGLGLPQCSKPLLVSQEAPVPHSPPLEPSMLTSETVHTPTLIAQAQEFSSLSKLSSCLIEKEYSVCSSESSMFSSDGPKPPILIPPLELPEVFPQTLILEPFVESSQLACPSAPPSKDPDPMVQSQITSESSSRQLSDNKDQLRPPREVPQVTVVAESMYGDFEQAMDHLRYRLIATRNPEEIRGGGLLKYSNLLVRDFKPASETEIKTLERYMCSRFFIDFPDVNEQQRKIESYLRNHFIGEEKSKYDYLMTLRRVVNESTVCLMGHERRQTLNMITILALKVLGEQNIIPNTNNVTCYYQPAPYMADHNFSNYYIANGQSPLIYHPYPLHIHMQTGLV